MGALDLPPVQGTFVFVRGFLDLRRALRYLTGWIDEGHSMTPLRITYLALTVIGTVLPMSYFVAWFRDNNWDLGLMVSTAWHANAATSGLVYDLTIAAVALTIWIIAEARIRRDWLSLIAIPATYCIGVSCGLPLYLFLRSRKQV